MRSRLLQKRYRLIRIHWQYISAMAYSLRPRKADGLRTFDSLISATAIERGLTLVSRNRNHFAMIDGLRLEAPPY